MNIEGCRTLAFAVFDRSIKDKDIMKYDSKITQLFLELAGISYDYYAELFNKHNKVQNKRVVYINDLFIDIKDSKYIPAMLDYINNSSLTIQQICNKYGISTSMLKRKLHKYNLSHRHNKTKLEHIKFIKEFS